MTDADKILQAIEELKAGQRVLQVGQQTLQATVEKQGKAIAGLQEGQKTLREGQKTLELKVETFHAEQKQANEEIIRIFHNIEEINQEEIEKRVERIERHLNLPPLK
jgi:seryl-tRNA synthetase